MTSQDDKREPKVYWADFNRHSDSEDDFFDFLAGDLLHKHPGQGPLLWQSSLVPMIEKKHYDALLAENQKLKNRLLDFEGMTFSESKEIEKLKSENSVLREAVEFYAHSKHAIFEVVDEHYNSSYVIYESDLSPEGKCDQPHGTKAREALEKLGI